jgi:hypothetical protein
LYEYPRKAIGGEFLKKPSASKKSGTQKKKLCGSTGVATLISYVHIGADEPVHHVHVWQHHLHLPHHDGHHDDGSATEDSVHSEADIQGI